MKELTALIVAVVAVLGLVGCGLSAPPLSPQQITSLPGLNGTVNFNQYSGYVTVNQTTGSNLFYWFVESQNDPATDPLVLWLNGGPGCSSLLGLLSENGPFILQPDGVTLNINPYAWNQVASIIYLESPAGVGFSYTSDGDYVTGDNATAHGNYEFLLGFFQLFPQFASNPFYVAGESFAGYYVPQTVYAIVNGNNAGNARINIQGFMVGNPSFDFSIEANAYLTFMAAHGLVSEQEYLQANETCGGNFYANVSQECTDLVNNITNTNFGLINPYNIYQDCEGDGPSPNGGCFTQNLASATVFLENGEKAIKPALVSPMSQTFIPCLNYTYISQYLSQDSVKEAIHVNNNSFPWTACSPYIDYVQYAPSMYPFYDQLIAQSLRIAVYSGDVDSCVPYLGTERCVYGLGLGVSEQWRPWIVNDQNGKPQTAGYTVKFNSDVTYITVKGAGHMVPTYKPQQAFAMFSRFIQNQPI